MGEGVPLKQSRQSNLRNCNDQKKSTAHLTAQTERFHCVHWPFLVGEGVRALLLPAVEEPPKITAHHTKRQESSAAIRMGSVATVDRQVLTSTSLFRSRSRPRPQPLSFNFIFVLFSFFFSLQLVVFSLSIFFSLSLSLSLQRAVFFFFLSLSLQRAVFSLCPTCGVVSLSLPQRAVFSLSFSLRRAMFFFFFSLSPNVPFSFSLSLSNMPFSLSLLSNVPFFFISLSPTPRYLKKLLGFCVFVRSGAKV